MSQKKLNLPDTMCSPQDLQSAIVELHHYARWLSHHAIKKQVKAKGTQPAPELTRVAKELLHSNQSEKTLTRRELDALITSLDNFLQHAQIITITLAAPAPGSVKQALVSWCRQNISDDSLINFRFNSTILGGMVVQYRSRIFDWSFRRRIMDSRHAFPEVLRRV